MARKAFLIGIVDDDLDTFFAGLPNGVHLEVILDCCHSATGIREVAGPASFSLEHSIKVRFLKSPVDILCRQDDDDLLVRHLGRDDMATDHVLFAACRDNQTASDAFIK